MHTPNRAGTPDPPRLRVILAAVTTLALALALSLTPANASADPPGHRGRATISGVVLGHFDPIGYATVTVYDADTHRVLRSQVTDESGNYEIRRLPAGPIKVRASKADWISDWASHQPTWASADVYRLRPGQHLRQTWDADMILYMDLTPAASVTGQVLGNSRPLAGSRVAALDAVTGKVLRSTVTDRTGHYQLSYLRSGVIKLRATKPGWRASYANGRTTAAEADLFYLLPGQDLDQSSAPGGLYLNLTRPPRS